MDEKIVLLLNYLIIKLLTHYIWLIIDILPASITDCLRQMLLANRCFNLLNNRKIDPSSL